MSTTQSGRVPPWFTEGRPQRPTTASPEIAVATSPPSITDAQDDNTAATLASDAATTSAGGGQLVSATTAAEFKYPEGQLTINSIDSVVVEYDTVWTEVSLGVSCSGSGVGGAKSFDLSLASAHGTYTLEPIDTEITVSAYPIECYLVLRDNEFISNSVIGPTLEITSTGGMASTYAISATSAAEPDATASATGAKGTSPSPSPTSLVSTGSSSNELGSAATPTDAASASTGSASSSGISAGGKAGIAIGVLLVVGLILCAIWFFYRQRRKMQIIESELQETKQQHEDDRRRADVILQALGKPDTRNGGRLVMADVPNRGSGEWKKFFSARAASAGASTAPPSRLATAVERPQTAEALPPLPDTPSWAGRASIGGDAASATSATDMVGRR